MIKAGEVRCLAILIPNWKAGGSLSEISLSQTIMEFGSEAMVTEFLEDGRGVNGAIGGVLTFIRFAVQGRNIHAVRLLQPRVENRDVTFEEVVVLAVKLGNRWILDILVPDWRAGGNFGSLALDEILVKFGNQGMVSQLINSFQIKPVSFGRKGLHLLRCAVQAENVASVKLLRPFRNNSGPALDEVIIKVIIKSGDMEYLDSILPGRRLCRGYCNVAIDETIVEVGSKEMLSQLLVYNPSEDWVERRGTVLLNLAHRRKNEGAIELLQRCSVFTNHTLTINVVFDQFIDSRKPYV